MNFSCPIQDFPGVVVRTSKRINPSVSVLIPTAGQGRRMKSYGPKALIDLGRNETVLSRQINLIRQNIPSSDITVVVGFDSERICKTLPDDIRVIENDLHETTNVCRSLDLGLKSCNNSKVLIIYGDLVFNPQTISAFDMKESFVVLAPEGQIGDMEVGVTVLNGYVGQFGYDLNPKWAQIVFLTGQELKLVRKIAADPNKRKYFGFEILNLMIDMGGKLKPISPSGMHIAEIDCSKDIENAMKIVTEN